MATIAAWSPIVLRIIGIVLMLIGGALWAVMLASSDLGAIGGAMVGALGGLAALGGRSLYNRGRRLKAASAVEQLPIDASNIVFYLRSFKEDRATSEGVSSGVGFGGMAVITEEEQLVQVLSVIGPVIAVGEPGEELPPLGARRLSFSHADWQREVEGLLRKAALVIIRPGSFSPGVDWEIRRAHEIVSPERLLIIITGRPGKHQDSDLAQFAGRLNTLFPNATPLTYPTKNLYRLGTIRAFVCFDAKWQPHLLPVAVNLVPFFKRSPKRRLVPYFQETLRPVLSTVGYPPPALQFSAYQVGVVLCLGLLALLLLIGVLVEVFS